MQNATAQSRGALRTFQRQAQRVPTRPHSLSVIIGCAAAAADAASAAAVIGVLLRIWIIVHVPCAAGASLYLPVRRITMLQEHLCQPAAVTSYRKCAEISSRSNRARVVVRPGSLTTLHYTTL